MRHRAAGDGWQAPELKQAIGAAGQELVRLRMECDAVYCAGMRCRLARHLAIAAPGRQAAIRRSDGC